MSVVAHGRYEEVPAAPPPQGETPGRAPARAEIDETPAALRPQGAPPMESEASFRKVFEILQKLPAWWQPGSAAWAARAQGGSTEPFVSIFFRIRLDAITGHAATPDAWAAGGRQ